MKKDYKSLKPTDKVRLQVLSYTEPNGSNLITPGVYEVKDLTEHVLSLGHWIYIPTSTPKVVETITPKVKTKVVNKESTTSSNK